MPSANRALTVLLGLIATILVGWVLHEGGAILRPLVIAFLLASMLQPVVQGLAKKGIPPALTVMLMVWLLFLGLVQVGLLINANVQALLTSAEAVGAEMTLAEDVAPPAPALDAAEGQETEAAEGQETEAAEETSGSSFPSLMGEEQDALIAQWNWDRIKKGLGARMDASNLPATVVGYFKTILEDVKLERLVGDLALGGFGFLTNVVLVLIYMVFIFAEQAVFRRKILSIAGDRRDEAAEVLETIGRGIQRYLGVKTVVSFLTAALCFAVLKALAIPYALLFGLLTFALNYIPTFGSIIAGVFPTITALAIFDPISTDPSWTKALIVAVTYISVNLTLGSFIEPRILGRELNLSPLVVVVSVVVWAGLWGVVGGFLAVPLTATLQICLASQETTRPIAIMLGSGPPREKRRGRKRTGEASHEAA